MQFSLRFKQLCKENGVTQKQALADMGLHRNAAQRWIDGSPSAEALRKMADYFGVPIDRLLNYSDKNSEENKKMPTPKGEHDIENDRILEALDATDPATREVVLRLLGLQ